MKDLHGKTVLLTGASSGLGPHIARRLHGAGARLILSARNEAALNELARELGRARVIVADLSQKRAPERLAQETGPVDVLVSNAGVPATGRLVSRSVTDIDRALAVNLRSGMVLARMLLPHMLRKHSGHVVFMSSIAGKVPAPGISLYNATKFALRGFGLALREELWRSGVGVSVICPTFVSESGMWAETGMKANPLAGEVKPSQVAAAVLTAITKNRGEIDVFGPQVKAGLVVQLLAPELFSAVERRTGAAKDADRAAERLRRKR